MFLRVRALRSATATDNSFFQVSLLFSLSEGSSCLAQLCPHRLCGSIGFFELLLQLKILVRELLILPLLVGELTVQFLQSSLAFLVSLLARRLTVALGKEFIVLSFHRGQLL